MSDNQPNQGDVHGIGQEQDLNDPAEEKRIPNEGELEAALEAQTGPPVELDAFGNPLHQPDDAQAAEAEQVQRSAETTTVTTTEEHASYDGGTPEGASDGDHDGGSPDSDS